MRRQSLPALAAACCLAWLLSTTASHAQDYAFLQDPIDYNGWTSGTAPASPPWSLNSGGAPSLAAEPAPSASSTLVMNNGVIWQNLDRPLKNDFVLTIDAIHGAYARAIWAGVFNSSGAQGYGLFWDSALSTQYGSQGHVSVRKYSVTSPATELLFNSGGTLLGSLVASGHNAQNTTSAAVTRPLARLQLVWSNDSHTLRLYVDGVLKSSVTDSSFTSFSRVYVGGGSGGVIDNIAVGVPAGASTPFTTFEAEDQTTNGSVVRLTGQPAANAASPELEASARGYVQLNATGNYVEFTATGAANTIVLRHCIPDASAGGGASATLSLLVNGSYRQALTLSSRNNWLYGFSGGSNGQSNSPSAGPAHVFWTESRAFLSGTALRAGDKVRLEKRTGDAASYYRIDLIDLENVSGPLAPPAAGTYLSVASYGANGSDTADDTAAIAQCITDAKAQGKTVWFPAGTYYQNSRFTLNGVTVRGAGMWHTSLIGTVEGTTWGGNAGFDLAGDGAKVSDMYLESAAHTARTTGGKLITGPNATNWAVENVWLEHGLSGLWMSGSSHGVIRGCRVRCTYADAINLNRGASYNLVEQNQVRGCGDDGIAILSESDAPAVSVNNTIRNNSVIANWWGHNFDLAGGSGHLIEYNCWADNSVVGAFAVNLPSSFPMYAMTGATVRRNVILRGGGNQYGQRRGAVWLFPDSTTLSNLVLQDNQIVDAIFRGIHLVGSKSQQAQFTGNVIEHPGNEGVLINSGVIGNGAFTNNLALDLNASQPGFLNNAGAGYTVTQSGNAW